MLKISVGHPGRQHSHWLAAAFANVGLLQIYCSGQINEVVLNSMPAFIRRLLPSAIERNAIPFLSGSINKSRPGGAFLAKLSRSLPAESLKVGGESLGFALFDRQYARLVTDLRPNVVVGYEMGCLDAFRAAQSIGAKCVLDAAACHYSLQDLRMVGKARSEKWPGRLIRRRKDEEAKIADLIICPSRLSAESYIAAGFPEQKVLVNPLGVDPATFKSAAESTRHGIPRFVFIANAALVKGADFVEAVITRLAAAGIEAEFDIVGGVPFNAGSQGKVSVVRHGHVSHARMCEILSRSDCLLLPSRLESFGMVTLEAMAAGVPVLLSDGVGSADVVEKGRNGWCFGHGLEEFVDQVEWCARNISAVRSMRDECVLTAKHFSWGAYQRRALEVLGAFW